MVLGLPTLTFPLVCFSRKNPFELLVALDKNGMAKSEVPLYWDDGDSLGKTQCTHRLTITLCPQFLVT